jgi:hypothetical protein
MTDKKDVTIPEASTDDAVDILLRSNSTSSNTISETAAALVEVYEGIEQHYRAAANVGQARSRASASTNG